MKFIVVLTLFALATATVNATSLRATAKDGKTMKQFMEVFGDAVTSNPEYKKDPVEYLVKFIADTKAKIQAEREDLISDAKAECTATPGTTVAVTEGGRFEERTLQGCTATSKCGAKIEAEKVKGHSKYDCKVLQESIVATQTAHRNAAQAEGTKLTKEIAALNTKRATGREHFNTAKKKSRGSNSSYG